MGSQAAACVSARGQLLECSEAHSPRAAPAHEGDSPEHDDAKLQVLYFLSVFIEVDGRAYSVLVEGNERPEIHQGPRLQH